MGSTDAPASAYSASAEAWADGPNRIYQRLAEMLVDFSPTPLDGRTVLDLGSGTGVGTQAALDAGAAVVAADFALGMLQRNQRERPPATVGDATALPFRAHAFDVVLAPFCLNHLGDPSAGVREAGRVGERLVGSTYAIDDTHPVKKAADAALREIGWRPPKWYEDVHEAMALWGTAESAAATIERGGMRPVRCEQIAVSFPELDPQAMAAWRLGLAQCATFVATLSPEDQVRLFDRTIELLGGDPEPVVRQVIFFAAA